jgi:hypothetical protein
MILSLIVNLVGDRLLDLGLAAIVLIMYRHMGRMRSSTLVVARVIRRRSAEVLSKIEERCKPARQARCSGLKPPKLVVLRDLHVHVVQ